MHTDPAAYVDTVSDDLAWLPYASLDEVYQISKELYDELWDGVTPLRLLGIAMTNITKEETMQFSLFQDEAKEKARKIDKAKDALNAKYGSATIMRGSSIQSKIDVGKKYKAQMELQKKTK